MEVIDFTKLSSEQKKQLREQMEAEQRAEKEAAIKMRADYEQLKNEQVLASFKRLQNVSSALTEEKVDVYNQFGSLLAMKKELYKLTEAQMDMQQSHTFTSADGRISIIIGSNVIDRWSDDVNVGIERVNAWIDSKIADPKDRGTVRALMKTNSEGVLKASRILDLAKHANERGDKELIEAVDFIRDQYRPEKTSTYVKAKYKDDNQKWQWLALSMSAV